MLTSVSMKSREGMFVVPWGNPRCPVKISDFASTSGRDISAAQAFIVILCGSDKWK